MAPSIAATLPPELISRILEHALIPKVDDERLLREPRAEDYTLHACWPRCRRCGELTLKAASLVCRSWRRGAKHELFRHVRVAVSPEEPAALAAIRDGRFNEIPLLRFLVEEGLTGTVTKVSIVVDTVVEECFPVGAALWRVIFSVLDPRELTVVGNPRVLGACISRQVFLGDAYWFDNAHRLQVLTLSRETRGRKHNQCPDAGETNLISIRPWTSVYLNEGSYLYDGGLFRLDAGRADPIPMAPSILPHLLGTAIPGGPADQTPPAALLLTPVDTFRYIAFFPNYIHLQPLLEYTPPIRRLETQFLPVVPALNRTLSPLDAATKARLWHSRRWCSIQVEAHLKTGDRRAGLPPPRNGLVEYFNWDTWSSSANVLAEATGARVRFPGRAVL